MDFLIFCFLFGIVFCFVSGACFYVAKRLYPFAPAPVAPAHKIIKPVKRVVKTSKPKRKKLDLSDINSRCVARDLEMHILFRNNIAAIAILQEYDIKLDTVIGYNIFKEEKETLGSLLERYKKDNGLVLMVAKSRSV